jgi:manganese/iron transport system ATP-binding protein
MENMSILKGSNYLIHKFPEHEIGTPTLKISDLGYRFDHVDALSGITFEVSEGERLAVVGPNGAGKSTLFKIIAGVFKPTQGSVEIYGYEPKGHICIAYVPQRNQVDWSFPVNVADVVMMGRISKMGPLRWPTSKDWQIVHNCLELVDMQDFGKRQISELSGGQQQRVFIAQALAQEAHLILMDEPLTGLDHGTQQDIFRILDTLREKKVTVMVAMHDLKLASERFDRVLLLNKRLIGIGRPQEVFIPERLALAYGGHLRLVDTHDGVLVIEDSCCDEGDHAHA